MSHHSEQTQIETGFTFFTDPKITAIVLWEFITMCLL